MARRFPGRSVLHLKAATREEESVNPIEARETLIRRIVSEVTGRAVGNLKGETRLVRDLALTGPQEDEIAWRIEHHLGVKVPQLQWGGFRNGKDLAEFVEMEIQRGEAVR